MITTPLHHYTIAYYKRFPIFYVSLYPVIKLEFQIRLDFERSEVNLKNLGISVKLEKFHCDHIQIYTL